MLMAKEKKMILRCLNSVKDASSNTALKVQSLADKGVVPKNDAERIYINMANDIDIIDSAIKKISLEQTIDDICTVLNDAEVKLSEE